MTYQYLAFGLIMQTDIAFFDLPLVTGPPDVVIRYGDVPREIENTACKGVRFQASAEEFLLTVDGIARYHVAHGRHITIAPHPGAAEDDILLFLMGSAIGGLLHQRNILPLHGSACEINGQGVIFTGRSGAGKSTLAAAFHQKGSLLLADDICAVSTAADCGAKIIPGFPQLKLWADSLKKLEQQQENLKTVRFATDMAKFFLPVANLHEELMPLKAVFILSEHNSNDFIVEPLHGMEKIDPLLRNTYRHQFLGGPEGKKIHFQQCSKIGEHASIVRIVRPRKPFLLQELMALIEGNLP